MSKKYKLNYVALAVWSSLAAAWIYGAYWLIQAFLSWAWIFYQD